MKSKEIKEKNKKDLEKLLFEKKETLRALRSNTSGTKTKNVKEALGLRKDIARMLTELNTKRLVQK